MVKNLPSSAGDVGSIPGQGTKIPQAVGSSCSLRLESPQASAKRLRATKKVQRHQKRKKKMGNKKQKEPQIHRKAKAQLDKCGNSSMRTLPCSYLKIIPHSSWILFLGSQSCPLSPPSLSMKGNPCLHLRSFLNLFLPLLGGYKGLLKFCAPSFLSVKLAVFVNVISLKKTVWVSCVSYWDSLN